MKYTIDNKIINIPDTIIKEYNNVTGGELSDIQIKGFYMMAKKAKASNINKYIVDCIKDEISLLKKMPEIIKKINNGDISSEVD